jgi:hypothetical protein
MKSRILISGLLISLMLSCSAVVGPNLTVRNEMTQDIILVEWNGVSFDDEPILDVYNDTMVKGIKSGKSKMRPVDAGEGYLKFRFVDEPDFYKTQNPQNVKENHILTLRDSTDITKASLEISYYNGNTLITETVELIKISE